MTPTTPPANAVTVLGLGAIGSALADAFLDNGHATTVWNRSRGKADELVAKGAISSTTVSDAVAASPLVVLCVLDYKAVSAILDSVGDAISGRVLVNLTSGTPDQARETAKWAADRGADYLDGGILADPEEIGAPETFLLYSGSQRAFGTHEATLRALGGATTYVGADPGVASLYFQALIGVGYETWIAYLHSLALVGAENLDAATFAPFVTGMFTAMTGLLTAMAGAVDDGHYPPDSGALSVHAALMDDLIDTRQVRGIDAEQLKYVKTLVDRRVADGHGADGFSSLIEAISQPAVGGPRDGFEATGDASGASVSVIVVHAVPGEGPRLHRHGYEEVFVVIEGEARLTLGDETQTVPAGQVAVVPAGVPHRFVNSGDRPLRQVDIHLSPRFETEWLEPNP